MDTYDTIDAGMSATGITLSAQDRANLRATGRWARFIAIVGLVFTGLGLLGLLGMSFFMSSASASVFGDASIVFGTGVFMVYIVLLALYIYPLVKLLQFANKIIAATERNNNVLASDAFSALKTFYKFLGIVLIVMIVFYVVMFVLSFAATAFI